PRRRRPRALPRRRTVPDGSARRGAALRGALRAVRHARRGAPRRRTAPRRGRPARRPRPPRARRPPRGGSRVMDWWSTLFSFEDYGALLSLVRNSIIAGAVLGLVGGLVGVMVMQRDMAFAVHGISELSFAGAAGALLIGVDVVL